VVHKLAAALSIRLTVHFRNFGSIRASSVIGGEEMSVTRVGEILRAEVLPQVPARTVIVLSNTRLQLILKRAVATSAEAADVMVALITPSALIALVMGLWRLTADLGWTETFPISSGFFSHWQVWIALAIGLKFGASALAAKLIPAEEIAKAGRQ
jgi:hypothetical protein